MDSSGLWIIFKGWKTHNISFKKLSYIGLGAVVVGLVFNCLICVYFVNPKVGYCCVH